MSLPTINETYDFKIWIPSFNKEFKARPYLAKEEKQLMFAAESNDLDVKFNAMLKMINNCIDFEDGKTADDLTSYDVEYIIVELRTISVGETASISIKCNECEKENEIDIDLRSVSITESEDTTFKLNDQISLILKHPTMDDIKKNDLTEFLSNNLQGEQTEKMFDYIRLSIDKVIDDDQQYIFSDYKKEEQETFIGRLNSKQLEYVINFIMNTPSTYIDIIFNCVHCEKENDLNVRGVQNFFS